PALRRVDRDRFRHCPPAEAWGGVGPLGARESGAIAIAHHGHDVVDTGWNHDKLLVDDALVRAQCLLKGAHPHLLIAPDLADRRETGAVGAERRLDVILRDELRPPAFKRERLIRERD